MRKQNILLFMAIIVLIFSSCDTETPYEKQVKEDRAKIQNHLSANNITAQETEAGYFYQILEENTSGEVVEKDDVVEFYYSISTLDGSFREVYLDENQAPRIFKAGRGAIWPSALDLGTRTMHVGEKYRFFVPSLLAFSYYGHEDFFPSYTNFIVDLKIAGVKSENTVENIQEAHIEAYLDEMGIADAEKQSSGLYYIEEVTGTGDLPGTNDIVEIKYTSKYLDGTVIKQVTDNGISTRFGSINPIGVKEGIGLMKKGGKATLIVPSELAYSESLQVIPRTLKKELYKDNLINYNVDPYSIVLFEVELVDMD